LAASTASYRLNFLAAHLNGTENSSKRPGIWRMSVYIDEIVHAVSRHMQQHSLGEVAVRIEQREPGAGSEVLRDQVQQQRRFAGTGLADDVEMTPPFFRG
jgi:hypothetical protein